MKAPAFRFERASQRAERVAKRQSAAPEPASDVSDPIDEQISSLLESVSSKPEAQAAVMDPDFSPDRVAPDRVAPSQGPLATPLRQYREPVDVRQVFSRIAIVLLSVALALLIVHLMSP